MHTCPTCGKLAYLAGKRGGCPECRGVSAPDEPHEHADKPNMTCALCGTPFVAHSTVQKYCGDKCRDAACRAKARGTEPYIFTGFATCRECGIEFAVEDGRTAYCSDSCFATHNRRYRTEWERAKRERLKGATA